MQFSVGDKVVHPQHGPGTIKRLARLDFKGQRQYYVIEIPGGTLSVYVPKREADSGAVRPVASESRLQLALETLRGIPHLLSPEPSERQEEVLNKLKTGRPLIIAEAVRDLNEHGHRDHLTMVDQRLLRQGLEMLAGEIALVRGTDLPGAIDLIETILEETSTTAVSAPEARIDGGQE